MKALRRWLIVLACALLLEPLPGLPPHPAEAQSADGPNYFTPGAVSGGVLGCDYASRSISNTLAASTLYSFVVPAGYVATQTLAPTLSASLTGWNWTGDVPLHVRMLGTFRSNQGFGSPGNFALGVNFGGANATISLVNAHGLIGSLVDTPWRLDAYILPYASAVGQNTVRLWAVFTYASNTQYQSSLPPMVNPSFYGYVLGTVGITSSQTFTVSTQWGSASQTNSINRHSVCWKLAE